MSRSVATSRATKPAQDLPRVMVRNVSQGWEVLGCFTSADGETLSRTLDLFATEQLAQSAATQFLARLRRLHQSRADFAKPF